jgi:hypothetical protein
MNAVHLHLIVNHLPVVGSLFAAGLLLFALARREGSIRRLALGSLLLVALTALPAYLSGEPAEEAIENRPGIEELRVERHEDLARVALIGLELAGAIALAALIIFRRRAIPGSLLAVALIVDLGAAALLARVATLGGEIRHEEIRNEAIRSEAPPVDD